MERQRRRRRVEDYVRRDDIDDPRLLRDGERLRIPMTMADDGAIRLEDHQPGPIRSDAKGLDAKERAYRERAIADEQAWMPPHLRPEPPTEAIVDAASVPSILNDDRFVENDRAETARAYADRAQEDENAWRRKG